MDARLFAPGAPGRLVPTKTRKGADTAFIPDPLPEAWEMPARTRELLARAHQAIAELRGAGEGLRAPQLAVALLQLREAIRSSASERSAAATAALLRFERAREGRKAWRDAFRYRRVLRNALASGLRVRALIQEIHAGLFEGRPRKSVFPGRLRRGFIQMGDSAHYVPPPYAYVVPCLAALERTLARPARIDPLALAFMVHYQFVSIHPFADGNGRVGRILLAQMLNRALMPRHALLYAGGFLVAQRREYTSRLFRVNTHGDWAPWIDFCLEGSAEAARTALQVLAASERLAARCPAPLLERLARPAFSRAELEAWCARRGLRPPALAAALKAREITVRGKVNADFWVEEALEIALS
jgi:Fic family protein